MSRLQTRFAELKEQNRAALVTFVTAGDPSYDTSLAILKGLPGAGCSPGPSFRKTFSSSATLPSSTTPFKGMPLLEV